MSTHSHPRSGLRLTGLLALAWLTGFAACTSSHAAMGTDGGPPERDASAPGADAASPRADSAPPEGAASTDPGCVDLCASRREDTERGFCPFATVPGSGECEVDCGEVSSLSDAAQSAFEWCVRNDPLCFQSADDCVYGQLYPEPRPTPVTVRGTGLEDFEGRTLYVQLDVPEPSGPFRATIVGGRFELTFEEQMWPGHAVLALLYIDLVEDGVCHGDADLPVVVRLERSGDFDRPAFAGTLDGTPEPAAWVCGML